MPMKVTVSSQKWKTGVIDESPGPAIDTQAERFIKSCDACKKVGKAITQEEMYGWKLPDGP